MTTSAASEEDASGTTTAAKTEAPNHARARVRKIDPDLPDLTSVEEAMEVLRDGGIVAFPTDTVYGLAVDATNAAAVEKLYALKGREAGKPLPVFVDTIKMLRSLAAELPEEIERMLDVLWPGPLTVVLRKRPAVLKAVTPTDAVGVRMPDSVAALGLVSMAKRPLAVTSANRSGEPPLATGAAVAERFGAAVGLCLDAGETGSGQASTVVSVVEETVRILRSGAVDREALERALGGRRRVE